MINNSPYNIPQKKPLAHSYVFSSQNTQTTHNNSYGTTVNSSTQSNRNISLGGGKSSGGQKNNNNNPYQSITAMNENINRNQNQNLGTNFENNYGSLTGRGGGYGYSQNPPQNNVYSSAIFTKNFQSYTPNSHSSGNNGGRFSYHDEINMMTNTPTNTGEKGRSHMMGNVSDNSVNSISHERLPNFFKQSYNSGSGHQKNTSVSPIGSARAIAGLYNHHELNNGQRNSHQNLRHSLSPSVSSNSLLGNSHQQQLNQNEAVMTSTAVTSSKPFPPNNQSFQNQRKLSSSDRPSSYKEPSSTYSSITNVHLEEESKQKSKKPTEGEENRKLKVQEEGEDRGVKKNSCQPKERIVDNRFGEQQKDLKIQGEKCEMTLMERELKRQIEQLREDVTMLKDELKQKIDEKQVGQKIKKSQLKLREQIDNKSQESFKEFYSHFTAKIKELKNEKAVDSLNGMKSSMASLSKRQNTEGESIGSEKVIKKVRNIEASIRDMGEDIHLIHDKQTKFEEDTEKLFEDIQKKMKSSAKESLGRFEELKSDIFKKVEELQRRNKQVLAEIEKMSKEVAQEIQTLKCQNTKSSSVLEARMTTAVQSQLKVSIENFKKQFESFKEQGNNFKASKTQKYLGTAKLFRYTESIETLQCGGGHEIKAHINLNERTFYIDSDGYLLDSDRYYILDEKNEKLRLENGHMSKLREHNILI